MVVTQRWAWLASGILVVAGVVYAAGDESTATDGRHHQQTALMLAKRASTQKVVDGLVSKNFDEIRRGAAELVRICNATEWAARGDQVYAHHRTELRRQAQKLVKMADEQNLDGAAFTYMHSLTTCISCHEYCRDVLKIADQRPGTGKIMPIPVTDDEIVMPIDRASRR
jgi:hypothetical protein